jgi:hypothetical protein
MPIISRTTRAFPAATLLYNMKVVHDSQKARNSNA